MYAIFKKELKQYFISPIGYVFIAVFMCVSGFFFWGYNIASGSADMTGFFSQMTFVFLIMVPFLTMRLIAEEKSAKTDQLLFTSPITSAEIVWGKALAAFAVFAVTAVIMLIYPIVLMMCYDGKFAWGVTFCNYIGFFLMGCAYISIGLFISSFTENQIISAALTFAVLLLLYLVQALSDVFASNAVKSIINALAINVRYNNDFALGILSLPSVIYYLSIVCIFVFLTYRNIELRKISK